MFFKQTPAPPLFRARCRNARCGDKLRSPTESPRDAFCCQRCEEAFYRNHCRVCEGQTAGKTRRRIVCWRATCRYQFKRHPELFYGSRYPYSRVAHNEGKTSTKTIPKIATFPGRPLRITAGPEVPPEINLRIPAEAPTSKANRAFSEHQRRAAAGAFQRDTPPFNIVGGYQFPNAPAIDLGGTNVTPSPAPLAKPEIPQIGDDPFDIPAFLKRSTTEDDPHA
jgi:hypothetical protein